MMERVSARLVCRGKQPWEAEHMRIRRTLMVKVASMFSDTGAVFR